MIKRSYNIGFGALACFVNDYGNWLEVAEIELFLFTTFSILLVYQLWCIETACKDVIDMNLSSLVYNTDRLAFALKANTEVDALVD